MTSCRPVPVIANSPTTSQHIINQNKTKNKTLKSFNKSYVLAFLLKYKTFFNLKKILSFYEIRTTERSLKRFQTSQKLQFLNLKRANTKLLPVNHSKYSSKNNTRGVLLVKKKR